MPSMTAMAEERHSDHSRHSSPATSLPTGFPAACQFRDATIRLLDAQVRASGYHAPMRSEKIHRTLCGSAPVILDPIRGRAHGG
jgi:hypothetical protein